MTYYLLEQDLRIPDSTAIGAVPEHIEPSDWIAGKRMESPGRLRLRLSNSGGGFRGDIIGTLLTLFSDDLKAALEGLGIDNVEYHPVELEDPRTHEVESGYWLINIVGLVACVDRGRSTIKPRPSGGFGILESFRVDPARTQGFRMFRLGEKPTLIVIDESLRRCLLERNLVGVRMRSTESYDGF